MGATGGAEASSGSVPGRMPVRPAVPWQEVQSRTTSAKPFRCAPPARLIDPLPLTVAGWQAAQVAAVTVPVRAGWPAGGIPWQLPQSSGAPVQSGVAFEPVTPLKEKLPWQ